MPSKKHSNLEVAGIFSKMVLGGTPLISIGSILCTSYVAYNTTRPALYCKISICVGIPSFIISGKNWLNFIRLEWTNPRGDEAKRSFYKLVGFGLIFFTSFITFIITGVRLYSHEIFNS